MWNVFHLRPISAVRQCRWKSKIPDPDGFATFKARVLASEKENAKKQPEWVKREESLRKRYGAWNPTRKLSRQQITDIRELKLQWPLMKTKHLADHFNVNPESIRRILKSKWVPNEKELEDMNMRAEKRKLASQEKKKAAVKTAPTTATRSTRKYGKKYSNGKMEGKRKPRPEDRLPYTVGIGDLID